MTRVKRTKNIFNENIVDQSLFHNQQVGEYKIGNAEIRSDWLKDAPMIDYIQNIYSSLKLAQLRQQLQKLKDQANIQMKQQNGQLSSPVKANLFKIAILKKKIQSFQIDKTGDYTKIGQTISSHSTFAVCQPPSTQKMLIQKLTSGSISFFQKSIVRKCFLYQKTLIIQSKKNEDKKQQWTKIDLEKYQLKVNHRSPSSPQKNQKLTSTKQINQNKKNYTVPEQFQGFQWVQGYNVRVLLKKKDQRLYCLYLQPNQVQKLFKYLKFHNFQHTLQKNKKNIFNQLNNQLSQKVITLFGNKLRMYDYNLKVKANQRNMSFDSPMKNKFDNTLQEPNTLVPKKSPKFSQIKNGQSYQDDYIEEPSSIKKQDSIVNQNQNMSQILFSPMKKRQSVSQAGNVSLFKLRTKKATVFYDQLQGDVNIKQIQQYNSTKKFDSPNFSLIKENNSPQFKASDINLGLKEEGMSQVDQNSSVRSIPHNRKRTTSISVAGHFFHQLNENQWKGQLDPNNKFNINIHEIESDAEDNNQKQIYSQSSKSSGLYRSIYGNSINLFQMGSDPFLPHQSTSSMSSLQLQEIQQRNELERHFSQPQQFSPRSYQTTSSGGRSLGNRIRLCLRQRQTDMKAFCYGIQMLYPYHKQNIKFSILQIDHEIQMQKYKVVCNQAQYTYIQKQKCKPRYSYFNFNQNDKQNQTPMIFGLNRQSNEFLFVLKEQAKPDYFFQFSINMKDIKYQQDKSQLILIRQVDDFTFNKTITSNRSPRNLVSPRSKKNIANLNQQSFSGRSSSNPSSFKFAAILHLYISTYQIQIWPQLKTLQFLKKYIKLTIHDNHYDFKHNFMEVKRKQHQLKEQVNKMILKNVIRTNSFKQNETLQQYIFMGMPKQIVTLLQKKLLQQQKLTKQEIWKKINVSQYLKQQQLKLLQQSFYPSSLRNMKMVIKPLQILKILTNFKLYNKHLRQRIYQVALYIIYSKSQFTDMIQNFITAISKQILTKLQSIILRIKVEEQIKSVIRVYLDVQYQIDELFLQVKKYFV